MTKPRQFDGSLFFAEFFRKFPVLRWRPVRIRLRTPPSSLRKPRVSSTTSNRAFLRAFPATQFPDSGLCGRSRILVAAFGALSLHPEIPFPAAVVEREVGPHCTWNFDI
jgi:hypothetical protein